MGFPHPATAPPYRGPQPWSTGLCDCTDDCGNCKLLAMLLYRCMTCFCPCVTFGRIAEIVDQGSTCKPSSSPTVSIQPNRCQHRLMGVFRWSAACGTSGVLYGVLEYLTCFHWVYSCCYRSKLRAQYSLPESPCADCLVHCCCEPCALCQEYRELKHRDFDMTIEKDLNITDLEAYTMISEEAINESLKPLKVVWKGRCNPFLLNST
ncbi:hypothetical protein B296_00035725 [Ensete ventricosum]|uniref:Uncharacterized protein n=1 Tax=Ensete ventricosum TaxID=4639 RepID=A0A426XNJ1_ENSVE|nr:hypothetical protein B296_00035725 [Ensete ventricosum]